MEDTELATTGDYPVMAGACELVLEDRADGMEPLGGGVFEAFLPKFAPGSAYRVHFRFDSGASWERYDP